MYELRCNGKAIAFFPMLKNAEKYLNKLINKDLKYNVSYNYEIVFLW